MEQNTDNIPAPDIQKEGGHVTGDSENNQEQSNSENAQSDSEGQQGTEYTPDTETTKEEMTGYNELPEQEKVGGA